jgi:hypothetical protein
MTGADKQRDFPLCLRGLRFEPIGINVFIPPVIEPDLIRAANVVCYRSGSSTKTSRAFLVADDAGTFGKLRLALGHAWSLHGSPQSAGQPKESSNTKGVSL